jgi:hypothetical protein
LSFAFADGTSVQIIEQRKKLFRVNDVWHIVQNGMVAAVARTDYSWKNKAETARADDCRDTGKNTVFSVTGNGFSHRSMVRWKSDCGGKTFAAAALKLHVSREQRLRRMGTSARCGVCVI